MTPTRALAKATLLITAIALTPVSALAEDQNPPTLSVSGTGTVSVEPDMARISFGVLSEGKTARQALDANNSAMASILDAMKDAGIAERDVKTSQFNIQPRYRYPKPGTKSETEPPRIVGYTVSNNVAVRVRDLANTGVILDEVVTLGVNTGGNIEFMNDDTRSIMRIARQKAVEDAIDKAKTLATSAGVKLGRILTISEGSVNPRPQVFARARAESFAADAAVPVAAGENTYRVNVQVNWEIDQ